jgi:hypothetical protein
MLGGISTRHLKKSDLGRSLFLAKEPRSQGAKEPRSQGAKEPRSQGAKEPRSQGPKEPRSQGAIYEGPLTRMGVSIDLFVNEDEPSLRSSKCIRMAYLGADIEDATMAMKANI